MEAANMLKFQIIFVLCLSILNMANCDEERHLCRQPVTVSYTEEVPKQLDEYGGFEKYFQKLGIPGGNKTVTKTRLEDELVCCPGYIKSIDRDCVPVDTTTETTTEETQASTELDGSNFQMDSSNSQSSQGSKQEILGGYLSYLLYALLAVGVLIICVAFVRFYNRKSEISDTARSDRVKYNAEMQKALI